MVCRAFRKQSPTQKKSFNDFSGDNRGGIRVLRTEEIAGRGLFLDPFGTFHERVDLESKFLHLGELFELPRLDIPPMTGELRFPETGEGEDEDGGRSGSGAPFVDWTVLDKVLISQITQAAPSFSIDVDEETHEIL